jgi:hypothetical protein
MSDMNEKLALARNIARRKVAFIRHASSYLVVIAGLALVNNLGYASDWPRYQWWLWVAFGWGIGVVAHFLSAFLYQSGSLVERLAKRELEKMDDSHKV